MSDNDVGQIKDRLTRLETKVEEKWDAHDKRADERWSDLMEKLHEMKDRPCKNHAEQMIIMHQRIKGVEAWQCVANWAIGVVYVAIVGVIVREIIR